ncbi:MAG: YgiT-type zinc finger protein [Candidatus Sumerlaeaceae bacterium]
MKRIKGLECPTCGKRTVDLRREDVTLQSAGAPYTVKDLEFWQCAICGERMYSPEAVRQVSPCHPRSRRRAAPNAKQQRASARIVRDDEVAGYSPATPTIFYFSQQRC